MSRLRPQPKLILAVAPILLIPAILFGVYSQLNHSSKAPALDLPEPPAEADYYIRDAELSSMDENGELLYRVHADDVLHFPDQSISMAKVKVSYLNGPWTLLAASGQIPPGEQTLGLSGDVQMSGTLRNGESVQLNTDDIQIHFQERLISTQAPVLMQSDTIKASAEGLETDMAGRELKLLSKVRVRYEP